MLAHRILCYLVELCMTVISSWVISGCCKVTNKKLSKQSNEGTPIVKRHQEMTAIFTDQRQGAHLTIYTPAFYYSTDDRSAL